MPDQSLLDGNVIGFKRSAHRLIERDARVAVVGQRLHLGAVGAGQVLLVENQSGRRSTLPLRSASRSASSVCCWSSRAFAAAS